MCIRDRLKAASIADEAFIHLLEDIKPGCTERSLAGRLEYYMRALGSEKASFDIMKSPENKNQLIVDEAVSEYVQPLAVTLEWSNAEDR